jgi:hypothetical protein
MNFLQGFLISQRLDLSFFACMDSLGKLPSGTFVLLFVTTVDEGDTSWGRVSRGLSLVPSNSALFFSARSIGLSFVFFLCCN